MCAIESNRADTLQSEVWPEEDEKSTKNLSVAWPATSGPPFPAAPRATQATELGASRPGANPFSSVPATPATARAARTGESGHRAGYRERRFRPPRSGSEPGGFSRLRRQRRAENRLLQRGPCSAVFGFAHRQRSETQ